MALDAALGGPPASTQAAVQDPLKHRATAAIGALIGAPLGWSLLAMVYDVLGEEQTLSFVVAGLVAGVVGAAAGFALGAVVAPRLPAASRRGLRWALWLLVAGLVAAAALMMRF